MANIRISDLTDLTTPTGSSTFPISHQGATRKISVDNLINYINITSTGLNPTYATATGLNASGISLMNSINSLSGSLNLSGISLTNTINSLSGSLNFSGTSLTNNITSLSGLFTGYTGSLDAAFASDLQLSNTGSSLLTTINSLSGSLNSSGISLTNSINSLSGSLSGFLSSSSSNIVFTTGDQTISGSKIFKSTLVASNISGDSGNLVIQGFAGATQNDSSVYIRGGSGSSNAGYAYLIGGSGASAGGRVNIYGGYSAVNNTNYAGQIHLISSSTNFNYDNTATRTVYFYKTGQSSPQQSFVIDQNAIYSYSPFLISGVPVTPAIYVNTINNQNISGAKTFFDSGIFSLSGASTIPLPNNPLSIVGSGNTYVQLNIQNRATGTNASADLVITANNGTDNSNFINLGINNSGYNDPAFTNGSGYDGYLYINGGNLDLGTQTSGTAIEFHIGGTTAARNIARITESGFNLVSGTFTTLNRPFVNGTGVLLSGETANLPTTIVYTTGDQTISGVKTFANGSNQILNTTYSNLTGLKATSGLLSGQLYRISDFVLKWNNQSVNDQTVKTAASGEPLIVTALSNKEIYHIAQSETYPQDTIYYNIDATSSYSWGTINNNVSIPDFKGWIYRRVDNLLNIDIPYDWRNITVNCCKPDVSSVPNYSVNYQYSKLNYVKETGDNSNRGKLYYSVVTGNSGNALNNTNFWRPVSDFVESGTFFSTDENYGFRALFDGAGLGDFIIILPALTSSRIQQPTFTSTLTGLGTFTLDNVKNIKIEGGYSNVIIGNDFYYNTIGNDFNFNTISNSFSSNIISNGFNNNTIGNYFNNNTIGNSFSSNIISNSFYFNTISNGFNYSTIGGGFNYNTIGNSFSSNIIGYGFNSNTIGNGFIYNTIGNGFNSNIAENNFNSIDFSSSTHVYNSYNTTLFENSANSMRLRYFNGSDQLVVTDPTA